MMESFGTIVNRIVNTNAPPDAEDFQKRIEEDKKRAILETIEEVNAEVDEEGMAELPCDICHGKGHIDIYDPERMWRQVECTCMKARRALRYVVSLGLLEDVKKCSFDTYVPYDEATERMKAAAMEYVSKRNWLYLGGQSGSGKSHLAYAIFGALVKKMYAPVWMRWIQESQELKQIIGEPEYEQRVSKLQKADILIIDDFFNLPPTDADIRLARIIIDDRYTNNRPTVITTELALGEVEVYDDAIAGRIAEMATLFQIAGKDHNYRMRNVI